MDNNFSMGTQAWRKWVSFWTGRVANKVDENGNFDAGTLDGFDSTYFAPQNTTYTKDEVNTLLNNYQYAIIVVDNYSALPDPITVSGEFYWATNSQGTSWLPGSIGGTFYNSGMYYSNGVAWSFLNVPYQTTQAEVDAGTVTDKFVTPNTFNNASKWANYSPTSHRHDGETITPDVVEFQTPASIPTAIGSTYYDAANKVLSTVLDGAVLQNGLELYVRVVNKTGGQISDGQAVYISGAQGNRPTATLAIASTEVGSNVIGVATQNIPDNQEGFVTVFGSVDYNTQGMTDGGLLYLSGVTAGLLTQTEQLFPLHKVVVATALNSTNNGKIFVRPYHVFELAEIHGVDLIETTPTDADSLLMRTSGGIIKQSLFSTLKTFLLNTFAPKANPIFSGVVKVTKIAPNADSTTALQIMKADGVAEIAHFDTINGNMYVGDISANSRNIQLTGANYANFRAQTNAAAYSFGIEAGTFAFTNNINGSVVFSLSSNATRGRLTIIENNININSNGSGRIGMGWGNSYTIPSLLTLVANTANGSNSVALYAKGTTTNPIFSVTDVGALTTNGEIIAPKSKHTIEGGLAIKLTNKTGAASVKGTVVYASTTTDNAFNVNPIDGDMPFGIVYENGIADGSECWVVVSGIAEVLLVNSVAATRSYIAYASGTTAGRIDTAASAPAAALHFREVGNTLESKAAGTNVLVKCVLHFN